jgi:hypothetical protein
MANPAVKARLTSIASNCDYLLDSALGANVQTAPGVWIEEFVEIAYTT